MSDKIVALSGRYVIMTVKKYTEEEIKTMAKYLGCTHIVNLRWRSDTGEEEGPKGGTHIYTVWQAIGYAAK